MAHCFPPKGSQFFQWGYNLSNVSGSATFALPFKSSPMRSNTILQKNSLFRDDLFKIDTSIAGKEKHDDRAHYLLGYYGNNGGKMDASKIGGKKQIPILIGEGFMVVRTFFKEIDTLEWYDLHYPVRSLPSEQDYQKHV